MLACARSKIELGCKLGCGRLCNAPLAFKHFQRARPHPRNVSPRHFLQIPESFLMLWPTSFRGGSARADDATMPRDSAGWALGPCRARPHARHVSQPNLFSIAWGGPHEDSRSIKFVQIPEGLLMFWPAPISTALGGPPLGTSRARPHARHVRVGWTSRGLKTHQICAIS